MKNYVSVIIPFWNMEPYLEEAITSVFKQTFNDWEIILIDDGSIDKSPLIAKKWAKQYPDKISFTTNSVNQNRGASASRNLGIQLAKGNLIAFLDADDIWIPEKLQKQVHILKNYPEVGWVFGRVRYFFGDSKMPIREYEQSFGNMNEGVWKGPSLLIKFISDFGITPCLTATIIRKHVLNSIGGFDESFKMNFTDQVLFSKINSQYNVYIQSEIIALYRQHNKSSWNIGHRTGKYYESQQAFWFWVLKFKDTLPSKLAKEVAAISELGLYRSILEKYKYEGLGWLKIRLSVYRLMTKSLNNHLWIFNNGVRMGIIKDVFSIILLMKKWQFQHCKMKLPIRFGSFRRLNPISRVFGLDRGLPICWYYIHDFLLQYAEDIRGHVLEIGDDSYTRRFGGDRVDKVDVLHATEGNQKSTIIADLTCGENIPSDTFNCIICTQTLHVIYDVRVATETLYRILKPGGVLLVTLAGISQISRYDMDRWGDYWRFTTASAHKLFEEFWPIECLTIEAHGNVLVAISYLHGLASDELQPDELKFHDPDYQMLITVRAVKPFIKGIV